LAALHTRSVPHGRIRSIDKELDRFVARSQRVTSINAPTGEALLDLSCRLKSLRSLVPEGPVALVHGDCKPSQFMLQQDRVALIDLDHCGLADPAYDVGNFLATMRQLAIREGLGRTGAVHMRTSAERLGRTFVEAYIAGTTDNRDAIHDLHCRVRWYEAVALERKALRAFARAPLSPLPVALVIEAHRKLDVDFQEAGCVQNAPSD
jgi:aminoglycoside phosphotransferase (APT) family kinase protein